MGNGVVLLRLVVCKGMGRELVFFFKQKTAYEMLRSLVGSEMGIRDRDKEPADKANRLGLIVAPLSEDDKKELKLKGGLKVCLLYTSDAADDLLCVDLGGRRLIQKKIRSPHNIDP